ncbi:MAG: DMT family transporter [Desulfuromonadales bacterium]|nr:DMT family transporter [Desulfuromonadales bacterium]
MCHRQTEHRERPLLKLLLGSVCISFAPIFIRLADVSPDSAGFYRLLFASLSLLILIKIRGENLKMAPRPTLLLVLAGIFLSVDFMCWHRSIGLIGPGLSTLLGNFQVFFTALFSWLLFQQRISRLFILAVAMALCGLLLITGGDWQVLEPGYKLGLLFGVLTALFYSGYILLLKQALNDRTAQGVPAMLIVSVPGTLLLALVTPVTGGSFVIPDSGSLFALIGAGVFSSTIGWSLISTAIKQVQATIAGLVLLLQPTLALIWDVLFFDRPTGLMEVFGVSCILSAIYIGTYRKESV